MICILSESYREYSSEAVMLWLEYWKVPFCRLNADDLRSPETTLTLSDGRLDFEWDCRGRRYRASDVTVAWFRRWADEGDQPIEPEDILGEERWRLFNTLAAVSHLDRERRAVSVATFRAFADVSWLNPPWNCHNVNKLVVLAEAQRCGLDTPATLVSADPQRIREFGERYGGIIAKCANHMTTFMTGEYQFVAPATAEVDLQTLPQDWLGGFPTLVQEHLQRAYELRIFYLDGACTTFAYVHEDSAIVVDGRIANPQVTRYVLPEDIRASLERLMRRLGLDMGCIDMVRTRTGRWVFLEINPNGQYWSDGISCNERLDKQIAQALVRRMNGTNH